VDILNFDRSRKGSLFMEKPTLRRRLKRRLTRNNRSRLTVLALTVVVAASTALSAPVATADPRCQNNDPFYGFCVGGRILQEFNETGGLNFFGNATNNELPASRDGRWQPFAKGSSIYWHPLVSGGHANQIGGLIRDKWGALGWEDGALRYPTTRELPTRKAGGRLNRFEGGNVYWSQTGGAHAVWGSILQEWGQSDYEVGRYGFPTTDEVDFVCQTPEAGQFPGKLQYFEGGRITYGIPPLTLPSSDIKVVNNGAVRYRNFSEFLFDTETAVNSWNALGLVNIATTTNANQFDLTIRDTFQESATFDGRVTLSNEANPEVMYLNTAFLRGYQPAQRLGVIAHEWGHVLQLRHSCYGELMVNNTDARYNDGVNPTTTPQNIDRKSYNSRPWER
jgi:hypothetical protein